MLKTIQTCDRCGAERELKPVPGSIADAAGAKLGGWREIGYNAERRTVCPSCVQDAISWIDVGSSA